MAIKISLVADVANALGGAEKVADAYEGVQDALDDVAREARKTEDALADVGDGTKAAADAGDDMAKKFRDDFDKIRKDAKGAGDGIGKGIDDGADKAAAGMDDLKDEAAGTSREMAASFDGSVDSLAEGLQEVAANAFAGFGPAGAAAGLAVAAGIGIAISKLTEYAEEVNAAKEAGAEWAQSFNTANMNDRLDALRSSWEELGTTITNSKEWYEIGQENGVSAIEDIAEAARAGVGDVQSFLEAFNTTDPERRLDALKGSLSNIDEQIADLGPQWKASLGGPEAEAAYLDRRSVLENLRGVVQDQIRVQENANEIEDAYAASAEGSAAALAEKNERIEESNELLEENADANRKAFRSELDLAEQLKQTNEVLSNNESSNNDRKAAVLDAIDAVIDLAQAEEEASGSTEDYNRVISRNREQLYEQGRRAGITRREMDDLIGTTKQMPREVATNVTDRGSADRTRRELESVLETAGVKRDMTIGVRASTAQAQQDVANFRYMVQATPLQLVLRGA